MDIQSQHSGSGGVPGDRGTLLTGTAGSSTAFGGSDSEAASAAGQTALSSGSRQSRGTKSRANITKLI